MIFFLNFCTSFSLSPFLSKDVKPLIPTRHLIFSRVTELSNNILTSTSDIFNWQSFIPFSYVMLLLNSRSSCINFKGFFKGTRCPTVLSILIYFFGWQEFLGEGLKFVLDKRAKVNTTKYYIIDYQLHTEKYGGKLNYFSESVLFKNTFDFTPKFFRVYKLSN